MDAQTKWRETTAAKTRPRLSLKRVALLGLAGILFLATAGYGYYWWAIDRFFQVLMTPMSAATSPCSAAAPSAIAAMATIR